LYSDSKYVFDGINKGWARKWKQNGWILKKYDRALNTDLWERLLGLTDVHDINFIWVKGHADNEYNELCDRLAKNEITNGSLNDDCGFLHVNED